MNEKQIKAFFEELEKYDYITESEDCGCCSNRFYSEHSIKEELKKLIEVVM